MNRAYFPQKSKTNVKIQTKNKLATPDKYIEHAAPIEGMDFVQPVLQAGSCRPLEALFITARFYFLIIVKSAFYYQ